MELKQISTYFILFLVLVFLSANVYAKYEQANANFIDYAGYSNCIKLENKNTRVVLGPDCGGRVLEYSWKNKNIIYLDPRHDGWMYHADKPKIDPSGGRFDIGPENIIPKHPKLWLGKWRSEIIDSYSARLISHKDNSTGAQLIREFQLEKSSNILKDIYITSSLADKPQIQQQLEFDKGASGSFVTQHNDSYDDDVRELTEYWYLHKKARCYGSHH